MSHATMLSNAALAQAMAQDPRYKALIADFEAKAKEALTSGKFAIKALGGVEMTLPEVAMTYQSYKSLGAWFFGGDDEARKTSLAYKVSQECKDIIKGAGYKADAEGIKSLIAFA